MTELIEDPTVPEGMLLSARDDVLGEVPVTHFKAKQSTTHGQNRKRRVRPVKPKLTLMQAVAQDSELIVRSYDGTLPPPKMIPNDAAENPGQAPHLREIVGLRPMDIPTEYMAGSQHAIVYEIVRKARAPKLKAVS